MSLPFFELENWYAAAEGKCDLTLGHDGFAQGLDRLRHVPQRAGRASTMRYSARSSGRVSGGRSAEVAKGRPFAEPAADLLELVLVLSPVVDPQVVQDRRRQVGRRDRVVAHVAAGSVVAPYTCPPRTPPPARSAVNACGQWSRPVFSVVAALGELAELRASGRTRPVTTTSVVSSRPARVQVLDEGRERPVEAGASRSFKLGEVLVVRVPAGVDLVVARLVLPVDGHERHAGLDQPPGQEQALAELPSARSARGSARARDRARRPAPASGRPAGRTRWSGGRRNRRVAFDRGIGAARPRPDAPSAAFRRS